MGYTHSLLIVSLTDQRLCQAGMEETYRGEQSDGVLPTNSASEKDPISGLGPDRDQCPNMVPKKAQFASQVPKLFDWS